MGVGEIKAGCEYWGAFLAIGSRLEIGSRSVPGCYGLQRQLGCMQNAGIHFGRTTTGAIEISECRAN